MEIMGFVVVWMKPSHRVTLASTTLCVQGLGAFCGFCCLPSVVVRGGILEHLLSALETRRHYGSCLEAEELLAGALRRDRARLAPREQERAP